MTKSELIDKIADAKRKLTRYESEKIVNIVFDSMGEALRIGENVEIRGFGSLTVRERSAREARNPKSGEIVNIPAKKIPFFKTGKELRERVDRR
jgi:integration host factor beta subunit